MQNGIHNSTVLRELHDALAAKDATIVELQDYIDAQAAAEVRRQDNDTVGFLDPFWKHLDSCGYNYMSVYGSKYGKVAAA